jgi:hypothetical protein
MHNLLNPVALYHFPYTTQPSPKFTTGESTCNRVIKYANEKLIYFGSGKIPLIIFMNATKSLLPSVLKVIMKMLSLSSADRFKLNVTFNQWQQNQLCHYWAP